jgi:hypothetical protein
VGDDGIAGEWTGIELGGACGSDVFSAGGQETGQSLLFGVSGCVNKGATRWRGSEDGVVFPDRSPVAAGGGEQCSE